MEAFPNNGRPPVLMTIAGSDCSGGAGVQADLKTFTALECYGTTAITALTAQNTIGVQGVHPSPPEFVEQQVRSVLEDMDVNAFKTGMLFDADITRTVANTLRAYLVSGDNIMHRRPPLVCDPVCVSTSGHILLHPDAIDVMINELFPLATLITPNKSEAEVLLGRKTSGSQSRDVSIRNLQDMLSACVELVELSTCSVLLKGGHITVTSLDVEAVYESSNIIDVQWNGTKNENMEILKAVTAEDSSAATQLVVDVLSERIPGQSMLKITLFLQRRISSTSTHGTGCTLSAALACFLAKGHNLVEATRLATEYTHQGITTAFSLGHGHGPLNHMHTITKRLIPARTTMDPQPFTRFLIKSSAEIWKEYVEHDFVRQLGAGTLRKECFIHFIKQDYHYLKYYARAYALLAAKSSTLQTIDSAAGVVFNILRECSVHKVFCSEFGITEEELESTREASATMAYGGYLLDIGMRGDETHLLLALAACLLGYGEVGLWIMSEARRSQRSWVLLEGNPYLKWIEIYAGKEYQDAVKAGIEILEARAIVDPPSKKRLREWQGIWDECTRLEKRFWDMAMGLME